VKELDYKTIRGALLTAGISGGKIDKVIAAIKISLVRQAVKTRDKRLVIDNKIQNELEESLRFGAEISSAEAKTVIANFKKTIKEQKDPQVRFFKEGMFEVSEDIIGFKTFL